MFSTHPLSVKRKFEMKTRATAWQRRRVSAAELVDAEQEEVELRRPGAVN